MKKRILVITVLGIVVLFLAGCGSGSSIKKSVEAMPMASPRLYLFKDTMSISVPSGSSISDYFVPGGGSSGLTNDWVFEIGDQVLKKTFVYSIYMQTNISTTAEVEFLLKQGEQESSLGKGTFITIKNQWQSYTGQVTSSTGATQGWDQLILRISLKADRWTLSYGPNSTCWVEVFENTQTIAENVLEERTNALMWLTENDKNDFDPQGMIFEKFRDQLDYVISSGTSGHWLVGDLLTKSENPYRLEWINDTFKVEEITIDELSEYYQGLEIIIFTPNP